ncbi:Alkylated DNA repair dioxygenase AlkB [Roseomonas rosea]|uniref:Alkylated DNA repair dioxygenase AlkB n=1 Tax=Muricoccus roseus TaxID=198092 RepID=A0A1M6SMJ6_9PROT|nr:alpha-ketoglutarate-dependent dioxygenase AlkB [Roseomonas rosea]SHK45933.1 Alkylated DNA repair dioxygenase AlkB [Roseomonas rosea]
MRRPAPGQLGLFEEGPSLPEGFRHQAALITPEEEHGLVGRLAELPFTEFRFGAYLGKRRTVSFGWHYEFGAERLQAAEPFPDFLLPLRDRAAFFAGVPPDDLQHALVTEYGAGAGIGWHRDKAVFGDVLGISLLAPCTFRFRRQEREGWKRASLILEPRSAYLLRGPSRTEWEHSIPAMEALRYSITFRSLRRP